MKTSFLPNFCDVRVLFATVLTAQLFSFVFTMAGMQNADAFWGELSLVSLFVQWLVLGNAALLCVIRSKLITYPKRTQALVSYILVMLLTVVMAEAIFWLSRGTALIVLLPSHVHTIYILKVVVITSITAAVMLRYLYVQHELKYSLEMRAQARIEALQARIRPHFLFNSMNTIASLTRSQPELAEEVVLDLADLFRATLSDKGENSTLADEINLCRRYLNIEQLRLGERLKVSWDVSALPENMYIPTLLLQPLLENAIYHGIEPRIDGGELIIRGRVDAGTVVIEISNPLSNTPVNHDRSSLHMAIDNIRERMALAFDNKAGIEIDQHDGWHRSRLYFPATMASHASGAAAG